MSLWAYLGMQGQGKTYAAKNDVRSASRVLVLDPHWEYTHSDFPNAEICESLFTLPDLLQRDLFQVIYRPEDEYEDFHYISLLAFWLRDALIVVDEAEQFYYSGLVTPGFRKAIAKSRFNGNSFILCGHRPTELPTKYRALCQYKIFRTQYLADLDFYLHYGDREIVEKIPYLRVGEYVELPSGTLCSTEAQKGADNGAR